MRLPSLSINMCNEEGDMSIAMAIPLQKGRHDVVCVYPALYNNLRVTKGLHPRNAGDPYRKHMMKIHFSRSE